MASGWDVYYVVFLSALLALGIPATLSFISRFILRSSGATKPGPAARSPDAAPAEPIEFSSAGQRVNTRFFLGANTSLLLITLALILVPCVAALQAEDGRTHPGRMILSVATVALFACLGLFYAARKGDLDWLQSYREEKR